MQKNINPNVVKAITRETLQRFGNPYWHCIAGETVYPVQMAVMLKIPLIIWGENSQHEYGGPASSKTKNILDNLASIKKELTQLDLIGIKARYLS